MSTLQKLKAYFGMVPAEDDYDFDDDYRRGYADDYDGYDDAREPRDSRESRYSDARYQDSQYGEAAPRRSRPRYRVMEEFDEPAPAPPPPPASPARSSGARRPAASEPATHGALAVDRQPEPVARLRSAPEQSRPAARDPLSRITTLHPTSYTEAREIGEAYRDGIPVIINLTEMENADAKRVVDFAAGLAFALRGSMDRVTTKVFLLSPPDVDVSAEDRKRIAEGGLFLRQ